MEISVEKKSAVEAVMLLFALYAFVQKGIMAL